MANRDLVVIGASAGGIEALQQLCGGLRPDLKAAVLVVVHTSVHSNGLLPRVLSRAGPLEALHPEDGQSIQTGRIYVAPPDFHMIVNSGRLRLIRGPRENRNRPAIDPTFRSAALTYGPRVVGVVLTGLLDDGTSGLMVIRARGGEAIVQDPRTALFPAMPANALERVPEAFVSPLTDMPGLIATLVAEEVRSRVPNPSPNDPSAKEVRYAEFDMSEIEDEIRNGKPSAFACPECGGVLWEVDQHGLLRFRCRVGHAYTARHLRAEQRQAIETALWSALRALEERASLYRRMAERVRHFRQDETCRVYEERAANAEGNSRTLRDFLVHVHSQETEIEEPTGIDVREAS